MDTLVTALLAILEATVSWMLMNVLFLDIVVMEEFVTIHLAHSFVSANLGFKDCDVRIILMTVDQILAGMVVTVLMVLDCILVTVSQDLLAKTVSMASMSVLQIRA